jgi:geranylgeranyl pyrophosphate synthase
MRRCGESLGLAFQIVDDVLDLVGDEAEVGKSLGRDAEMGKMTLPLIYCLQHGTPEERTELCALLRTGEPRRRVAEIARAMGGIEYAQGVAARYVAEARNALAGLPPSGARDSLNAMADFVLARHE